MCKPISWIEKEGTLFYLTSSDLRGKMTTEKKITYTNYSVRIAFSIDSEMLVIGDISLHIDEVPWLIEALTEGLAFIKGQQQPCVKAE